MVRYTAQQVELPFDCARCGSSEMLDPSELADEILGELNYGEMFAYLFRRFGYPFYGWDEYKELVSYTVTTPIPEVFLTVTPGHNSFGYVLTDKFKPYQSVLAGWKKFK